MLALGVSLSVAQYVLKAGWGFATDAHVTLNTSYYGHEARNAEAFLITGEGMRNVIVYPFKSKQSCLHEGSKLWVCWIAYDANAQEIGAGGIGFARQTIRKNGTKWLAKHRQSRLKLIIKYIVNAVIRMTALFSYVGEVFSSIKLIKRVKIFY